ncbi:hypothetical protein [Nocardioides ungokensis]|uniref:hypothetical protein n=1 Tax=Nocardioides ungokensis TaxID=1643322 RepID=UPI0015DF5D4A|nr:hypothetical protein [Nocardioides ungokensis]
MATQTGMKLIADALDLQHRLPASGAGRIARGEPYKARHVAQATHRLSRDAAAYVDEQLAPRLASCSWKAIETAVAHAIAKAPPRAARGAGEAGPAVLARDAAPPAPASTPAPPGSTSPATPST